MKYGNIKFKNAAIMIEYQGYTRKAFADKMMISVGTLHNKLMGFTPWTWEEVCKMAELLRYQGPIQELMREYALFREGDTRIGTEDESPRFQFPMHTGAIGTY